MKRPREEFVLPCTPEAFWEVFLDGDYGRALYLQGLDFKQYTVLAKDETSHRLHLVPTIEVPAPLARLVGEAFAYEEHGALDRAAGVWSWKMAQPAGVRRQSFVTISGTARVVAAGPGRCRRIDEAVVEANLFGLGGLLEATIDKAMRSTWIKEDAFLRRWLAAKSGGAA